MSELNIGMIYAMAGVFAASVGVWFAIRGARHSRGYEKEESGEKSGG